MRYMKRQEHFGRQFYQDKKMGYWISIDYPRIRAHRWVWINIHGKIPDGYHIHHKNEDKSDNRIENLELIEKSRHLSHHSSQPQNAQRARIWMDEIRPMTKEWHASEEGILWHRYHAKKNNFGNWEPKDYKCKVCNKTYKSKKLSGSDFCSNACKSRFRRSSGLDDVERKCLYCKKIFITNKYSKVKKCGRLCPEKRKSKE